MGASDRCSTVQRFALALTAAAALAGGSAANGADAGQGRWQQHQVTFAYMGDVTSGTVYSCEGLMQNLTFLLQQSGAKVNAPIQVSPCVHGPGAPSTLLTARLDFSTLVPMADQSGQGADTADTAASWRKVVFSEPHSFPQLRSADCELVQEFKDKLLQYFATRDVEAHLTCLPFRESRQYGLSFQAFVPADTPRRSVGGG